MSTFVFKAFSRHLTKHPWQLGLAIVGIMVGVAVIVAIRLTQHSAFEAFDAATHITVGHASHRLVGTDGLVAHDSLRRISMSVPAIPMSPVMKRRVTLPEHEFRSVGMLGVDPISRFQIASAGRHDPVLFDPAELIAEPMTAVVSQTTASELEVEIGSPIKVQSGTNIAELKIIALLPPAHLPGGLVNGVIFVDIATAQEVLQIFHGVSHVNLRIDNPTLESKLNREITAHHAAEIELIDLASESLAVKRMTAAFYSNLNALSLMALLVGMFLIYNTETFLVLQRREILGRLRALGVSRRQILQNVLIEATCLGAVGSVGGVIFGILLGNGLLGFVSTTINDLYFETSIETLYLSPTTLLLGLFVGVAATLVAAFIPALQATRMEPNLAINEHGLHPLEVRQVCIATTIVFTVCNVLASLVLEYSQSPNAGFAGICFVVIGFAALCPVVIIVLAALTRSMIGASRLLPERLGLKTASVTLNRTGTATAALMIATAASIGIGIMVTSFRISVSDWLNNALRADLYIADSRFDNQLNKDRIPPAIIEQIKQLPEVASTSDVLRRKIASENGQLQLSAFTLNDYAQMGFRFKTGDASSIWQQWENRDVAIVTEPYAYHYGISVGDEIPIKTDNGERIFQIVGIYLDYASERGSISISRATYDRHWRTSGYDGIGIYRDPNVGKIDLAAAITTALGENTTLVVNSTAELKKTSLEVFDRTFLITELLRAIAVIVSFIGVLGALLAQQLERTQQYGILRAIGFSATEMSRTVLTQTTLLGTTAALLAVPAGILIGVILIEVVNPRSFGWSMTMQIPAALVIESSAIALLAALCAGLYPSYRAARIEPADAMRYE